jgi:hypothetical protein
MPQPLACWQVRKGTAQRLAHAAAVQPGAAAPYNIGLSLSSFYCVCKPVGADLLPNAQHVHAAVLRLHDAAARFRAAHRGMLHRLMMRYKHDVASSKSGSYPRIRILRRLRPIKLIAVQLFPTVGLAVVAPSS